jgi:hypothetical protein
MHKQTFTYTARSATHPERVITFTLYDHSLSLDLGVPLEQIERAIQGQETEAGAEEQSSNWLEPIALALLQRGASPFALDDVDAEAKNGSLSVTAWLRPGGLRLAPMTMAWDEVDNPTGANTFVQELERRKEKVPTQSAFIGPFNYWASWLLGGLIGAIVLGAGIRSWLKRKGRPVPRDARSDHE